MQQKKRVIDGRGVVLISMLVLAIVVGAGARAMDRLTGGADEAPLSLTERASNPIPADTITVGGSADGGASLESGASIGQADAVPTEQAAAAVAAIAIDSLNVSAAAVYSYNVTTGELLIDRASQDQMSIGSIAKVATALVTIKHVALDDEVVIDASDQVDYTVYSNMGLIVGDSLTVEQLLMGLLIPSGGDAAEALARYVGGELSGTSDPVVARAAFVDEMNALVAELGLTGTIFSNAGGDDAAGSHSTAADVSRLAAALMSEPALAEIVATPSYTFTTDAGNEYIGANTNQLLGSLDVVGVKTGSTGDAGGCVVLAQVDAAGELIVTTILGSDLTYDEQNRIVLDARWDDARTLFSAMATDGA